jgi:hypothetical protein
MADRTHRIIRRIGATCLVATILLMTGCLSDSDSNPSPRPTIGFPTTTTSFLDQLNVTCSVVTNGTCEQLQLQQVCATCTTELHTTIDFADDFDANQLKLDFDQGHLADLLADSNDGRLNVVFDDLATSELDRLLPTLDDAVKFLAKDGIECHRFGKIPLCF